MGLLDGKTGLIVGIANDRSYAWHIAKAIIDHGGRCAFTHLPGEKNERRTRRAVEDLGVKDPWLFPLDAGKDEDIDAAFSAYQQKFDHMHFLVHSIAFADREWLQFGKFVQTPRQAYLGAIDISAYTLLAMARRAKDQMARSGGGSIMAMSYYGAEKVVPGYNVMGVAKAALECTGRYLAAELGEHKIRVNLISGGYLRTLASSAVGGTDTMSERVAERAPLRRNVEGADVGNTAVYLASDLSAGVTGETIYVDCGVNTIGA
ncbi:MAG: Enoyl-[acyl-carrier-protein] reductase [NADH] FabI [Phycisphaerales bacterium]|nr:Enoyl-[acyl-carrier-protein] reductase [NADH] FabI [Phycisphaerales bacterium]